MSKPTMVSGAYKNVCKKPTTSTSTQRSTERSFKKVEFTCNAKFTATSGLRQNLLVEGISERASNLITNNRRTSSIKHYKWDWKKWCGWCSEWEISLIRSNINYILDFLTGLFKKELEYRTIGTPRSAISSFHGPIGNIRVGNHPRLSSLMLGIFNKSSTQPKYPFIWDIETVWNFIRKLPGNDLLSDKLLIPKISIFLALLSVLKVSEITNLDYLTKHSSVYIFAIPNLTKTCQRSKKPHPNLNFYNFPDDRKLCVCKAIDSYLEERNSILEVGESQFLVSHIKPHKRVCLCHQSVGGWDQFLQWQALTQRCLRHTQLDQYHLQRLK